jgi:hypothetical protein
MDFGHLQGVKIMSNILILLTIVSAVLIPAYRLHLLYKKIYSKKLLTVWDFCDITIIPFYWYLVYIVITSVSSSLR